MLSPGKLRKLRQLKVSLLKPGMKLKLDENSQKKKKAVWIIKVLSFWSVRQDKSFIRPGQPEKIFTKKKALPISVRILTQRSRNF